MTPTNELRKLDEAHSLLVTMTEQGNTSAVLYTIASVLTQVPALDKGCNDPYFWQQVIENLNSLADTLSKEELTGESLYGDIPDECWDLSDELLNDDPYLGDDTAA
ncbi:MAG: hypothetical protein ACKO0Z_25200 [Betaproteobacteria bacterium]